MGISITQLIILCPLIFLSGFVDSIAGGGGLISLPAYMIIGLPSDIARGTNKLSAFMGTAVATGRYARKGFIPWKQTALAIIFALTGSWIGTSVSLLIDEFVFRIILLVVIPLTAIYLWFFKTSLSKKEEYSFLKTTIITSIISFVIGLYDGFYGPGTGTFLIILLTALAHVSADKAQGISKAINLSTNVASLIVFLTSGRTLIIVGLIAGAFSMIGSYVGTKMYFKNSTKIVRPIMIVVLLIFFVKTIIELLGINIF